MNSQIYKRFSSGESALKYIKERVEDWEEYLNGFAEGFAEGKQRPLVIGWQTLEEVSLRGIADGLAESDAELADGSPNPDSFEVVEELVKEEEHIDSKGNKSCSC